MNTHSIVRAALRRFLVASVVVFLVVCLGSPASMTTAQAEPTGPVLNAITTSADQSGAIMVSGTGFTLGGLVYIALYDQWGMVLHETRWITATRTAYQPPQELASGEVISSATGGNIGELFEIAVASPASLSDAQNPATGTFTSQPTTMGGVDCTTSLMARAYDRSTATWSNIVTVDLGC